MVFAMESIDNGQALSKQKPGVSFPYDSSSSKELSPDLEAIAMMQYSLNGGLKEFGKDGMFALGNAYTKSGQTCG
jgi:hypothetical protein